MSQTFDQDMIRKLIEEILIEEIDKLTEDEAQRLL